MRFLSQGRPVEPRRHGAGDRRFRPRGERHRQRAHRHHHGLGRAVDRAPSSRPPRSRCKNNSPKRIGPFAVPKAMSSTASATLATWFKIHGVNYSISSACSTSAHCIGNAAETDPVGQAGHDVRRRPRGSRLDDVEPVRRDGRDVVQVQRHAVDRLARLRRRPRRLRHRRRRRRAGARGTRARQGARRQDLCRDRRLRRDLGRLRHGRAVGRRRDALHAPGAGDREAAGRLHQHARHLDAGRRFQGDRRDPRSVRRQDARTSRRPSR